MLQYNYPLVACLFFVTALNLDLVIGVPLVAVFLVQAIGGIIVNSPSAFIVKQVDYIVWKVIFLGINGALLCAAIWWPYITTTTTSTQSQKDDVGSDDAPATKLSLDFKPAKKIISE